MTAADYDGYRHVFPIRDTKGMVHPYKNEVGTYSHWALWADVQALEAAPLNDVVPGEGERAGAPRKSQQFVGTFSYSGMDGNFGPESDPSRRHKLFEFHGAVGVFENPFGHDGTRETNYSNFYQIGGLGANDPLDGAGHPLREFGEAYAGYGPTKPYIHQGASSVKALDNPDDGKAAPNGYYSGVRVHNGAASTKAL